MKCTFVNLGKHFGGAENYLLTIIKNWISKGNEAIIITRKNSEFSKVFKENSLDVQVEEVDFTISDIRRTKRILTQKKVELVNINGINSGVFISLVHLRIPKVTTVHSNAEFDRADKTTIIKKIFIMMENYYLKRSDKIIVVSDALRELLVQRGICESKIVTIHNGVKKINYTQRNIRKSESDTLNICYAGRLEKVKGCEYLIRALDEMKKMNFKCDIYGEGSVKKELINQVKNLKIESKISFKGFTNKIRELLPEYDVLVLPSLFEAFPLTIPEAMNAHTLIVCSNAGGLPWIIKNGVNGYLFESKNSTELATILKDIYYTPDRQKNVIDEAYREFEIKYTEEIMLKKTFDVLFSVGSN
ncbi:MAG: glycosyltransferase family 4 protein [Anaerostipes sp.]|nr:glycosyltransferase family 4 protein [Anaerostipes sp.]